MKDYENLYGLEYVSYNLHAHIYLPDQASLFGPINKVSSFSFEGNIKFV